MPAIARRNSNGTSHGRTQKPPEQGVARIIIGEVKAANESAGRS